MESTAIRPNLVSIFTVLKLTFTILPIAAGIDKFFNILCDWTQYINPMI